MVPNTTKGNGQTHLPTMPSPEPYTPRARTDATTRRAMIGLMAYFVAERRGFKGGSAEEDWTAAEALVDQELALRPVP